MNYWEKYKSHANPKISETLMVQHWSSRCGNCGDDCNPHERAHNQVLGYNEEKRKSPGCGVEWKYIYSEYNDADIAKTMEREDLKEISHEELFLTP